MLSGSAAAAGGVRDVCRVFLKHSTQATHPQVVTSCSPAQPATPKATPEGSKPTANQRPSVLKKRGGSFEKMEHLQRVAWLEFS
jgi:hypothetical protein